MKFNETKETDSTEKRNFEGGQAFEPSTPEMGLYKVTINNLLEDRFYESGEESLEKVRKRFKVCAEENPEFVLKLASYSRNEMYLRDISQLLLVLSANHENTREYVEEYAPRIIQRADEPATVVAMQLEVFGKPIPKVLKRGIEESLHQFDEYQFSKYKQKRRKVSMVDVFNLVHPKPEDEEEEEIYERIVRGELDDYPEVDPLEPPETWEVIISEKGNTEEAWREVLPKMGIFAKIRNLRNMLEAGLKGEEILGDEDMEHVKNSMLYPFRFYQAWRATKRDRSRYRRDFFVEEAIDDYTEDWLSRAIDVTAENIPDDLSDTFVAVDVSGSMQGTPISGRSNLTAKEIATLFGAILERKGAHVCVFADDVEMIRAHKDDPTLSVMEKMNTVNVGGSTNGWKGIKKLRESDYDVDRIVYLTDMQIWDSVSFDRAEHSVKKEFSKYREKYPDTYFYMMDLTSYGDLTHPEGHENVFNINGWNSKIVEFIEKAEKPREVIDEVESY